MASNVHSGNGTAAQTFETEIPLTATVETERTVGAEVKEALEKETKPVADQPTVTEVAPAAETTIPKKKQPVYCVFRVIVPVHKVESIIGRNRVLIKKMCEDWIANIRVLKGPVSDPNRIVEISGKEDIEAPLSPAMDAVIKVFKCVNGFPKNESDGVASIPFCSIRLLLTSMQATSLLEKQGSLLKRIQENTGCYIRILSCDEVSKFSINSDDRVVNLKGEGLKVLQALEAVLGQLRMFLVDHNILPVSENTAKTVLNTPGTALCSKKRRRPTLPPPQVAAEAPVKPQKKRMVCSSLVKVPPELPQVQPATAFVTVETKTEVPPELPQVQPANELMAIETKTEVLVSVDDSNMVDRALTKPSPDRLHLYKDLPPTSHLCNPHCPSSGMKSIKEPKRNRYLWKDNIVKTFLDACIHEIAINGREGGSLKGISWKKVGEMLKASHNFPVDSKQMKNYFDGLKSKYRAWVSLKNKNDNKYDPSINMFNLTDKEWETEIKKNKCIETLRKAPLRFPDLCAQLFDDEASLEPQAAVASVPPSAETLLPFPATETPVEPQKEPMVEVPRVQPASEIVAIETKRSMSVFEEEILGVLKMIAEKMNKPESPTKPTFEDCEKKLNELGWPKDDPLHLVALTIFCDEKENYRELWMKLNPDLCAGWVRMIGRSKRFT